MAVIKPESVGLTAVDVLSTAKTLSSIPIGGSMKIKYITISRKTESVFEVTITDSGGNSYVDNDPLYE